MQNRFYDDTAIVHVEDIYLKYILGIIGGLVLYKSEIQVLNTRILFVL